jgi:hypothetical protein
MRNAPGAYRMGVPAYRYGYPGQRTSDGRIASRYPENRRGASIRVYNYGYPYPYALGWWIGPGYPTAIDDGYDDSYADQSYAPYADYGDQGNGYVDEGYGGPSYGAPQYGDPGQPAQAWPSIGPYAPQQSAPIASAPEPAITVVLKNGRSEQVHNYVLTRNYIFIGDTHGVTIPMDQIDVAATEQANRDAGVDFHIPQSLN